MVDEFQPERVASEEPKEKEASKDSIDEEFTFDDLPNNWRTLVKDSTKQNDKGWFITRLEKISATVHWKPKGKSGTPVFYYPEENRMFDDKGDQLSKEDMEEELADEEEAEEPQPKQKKHKLVTVEEEDEQDVNPPKKKQAKKQAKKKSSDK